MFRSYRTWLLLLLALLLLGVGFFVVNGSLMKLYHHRLISALRSACIKEHQAQLSMGEMSYLSGGDGFPIVFVHGFGAGAPETWKEQLLTFAKTHRVLAPDLFWFGHSIPRKGQTIHTPDTQAQAIAELQSQHSLARVHLVGVSFGGYVSLRFALRYPKRVASLTLVDSAGLRLTTAEEALMRQHFPYAKGDVRKLLLPDNIQQLKTFLDNVFYKPRYIPGFVLQEILHEEFWKNKQAKARIAHYLQNNFVSTEQLKTIRTPTQVIWGRHDRLLPSSIGQRLARLIPNARLAILSKSGHTPMLEQPQAFNQILRKFLQQVSPYSQ